MFDDLEGLSVENAFQLFNRTVLAARQFFLTLHDQDDFRNTALTPFGNTHKLQRNGGSSALSQPEDSFQVSTLSSVYQLQRWNNEVGAYAAFYVGDEEPELHIGAFVGPSASFHWDYEWTDDVDDIETPALHRFPDSDFPYRAASNRLEVVYDIRPWRPGDADEDVRWALSKLARLVSSEA